MATCADRCRAGSAIFCLGKEPKSWIRRPGYDRIQREFEVNTFGGLKYIIHHVEPRSFLDFVIAGSPYDKVHKGDDAVVVPAIPQGQINHPKRIFLSISDGLAGRRKACARGSELIALVKSGLPALLAHALDARKRRSPNLTAHAKRWRAGERHRSRFR